MDGVVGGVGSWTGSVRTSGGGSVGDFATAVGGATAAGGDAFAAATGDAFAAAAGDAFAAAAGGTATAAPASSAADTAGAPAAASRGARRAAFTSRVKMSTLSGVSRRMPSRIPGRLNGFSVVVHASSTVHSPRSTGVLSASWIENAVSRPIGRVFSVATKNDESSQNR